jgi:predicted transcriptional regulator
MKSVRPDREIEARLARAARALAVSESAFIREAVSRRCAEVLKESLKDRLAPVIGIVTSAGGRADDTGAAFRRKL